VGKYLAFFEAMNLLQDRPRMINENYTKKKKKTACSLAKCSLLYCSTRFIWLGTK